MMMKRERDSKRTIVLVDDNISNLAMGKLALKDRFNVFTVPSAEKFFSLTRIIKPDLVLLDVEMPDMDGYEVLRKLHEDDPNYDIPVIFLTAKSDVSSEIEGLALGADDYISKPFSPVLLVKRIENSIQRFEQKRELVAFNNNLLSMVSQQTGQIMSLQSAMMRIIANLIEYCDDVTGSHVERTGQYLTTLLDAMREQGLHSEQLARWDPGVLVQAAQLHDVGKIGITDMILCKPGRLTAEEFEEMKRHVEIGESIIRRIQIEAGEHAFLEYAQTFISAHHEKWDGSGYPRSLKGDGIPLLGRLMAIVDVYDALTTVRPYKDPIPHDSACDIMRSGSGTHFDPALMEMFLGIKDRVGEVLARANSDDAGQVAV